MAQITFDSNNLTVRDREILALIAGGSVVATDGATSKDIQTTSKAVSQPKVATPAKSAPEPEPVVEEPEEEPEDDLLGSSEARTPKDAMEAATALVSDGKAPLVKEALKAVGVKRVGELQADQVEKFFAVLEA